MAQVLTHPQQYPFEGSFHRLLAPAPHAQPSVMSHPSRDMGYNPDGYYVPPGPPRHPLNTRSSSVSSTSSSTSYAASYSTGPTHHGSVSRNLSPPASVPDPGTAVVMYPRSHYPDFAHDYQRTTPVQHTSFPTSMPPSLTPPLPSQYLQPQYGHSASAYPPTSTQTHGYPPTSTHTPGYPPSSSQTPVYPPTSTHTPGYPPISTQAHAHGYPPTSTHAPGYPPNSTQRHLSRPPPHGSYSVDTLLQQPSPMWDQTGAPMYPSFSTPAYHSPQHVPSYQTPPPSQALIQAPPMNCEPKRPPTPPPMSLLKQLPADVVKNIRMMVGWEDCWNVCQANHWFRENFHPDSFSEEAKLVGLLDLERLHGRHGGDDSDMPASRKSDSNGPEWLGCYHCYRRKPFECFELFKWANSSSKGANDADEPKTRRYKSPSQKQGHPYSPASTSSGRTPPPTNPHYDPSLTRSGLTAAAASRGRRTSPDAADSCSDISPRIRETWGVRRFCVECGLDKGYYSPGDLIDVQRPKEAKLARWVCRCRRLHQRPRDTKCSGCGDIVPLSCPRRI